MLLDDSEAIGDALDLLNLLKNEHIPHVINHLELFHLVYVKIQGILRVFSLRKFIFLREAGRNVVERLCRRIVLVGVIGYLGSNQVLSVVAEVLRFGNKWLLFLLEGNLRAHITLLSFRVFLHGLGTCLLFGWNGHLLLNYRNFWNKNLWRGHSRLRYINNLDNDYFKKYLNNLISISFNN